MTGSSTVRVVPAPKRDGGAAYGAQISALLRAIRCETLRVDTRAPSQAGRILSLLRGYPANSEAAPRGLITAMPTGGRVFLCEHLSSARTVLKIARPSDLVIYVSQNLDSSQRRQIARSAAGLSKIIRLADAWATERTERKICLRSRIITAISDDDVSEFRSRYGRETYLLPPFDVSLLRELQSDSTLVKPFAERMDAIALFGSTQWAVKQGQFLGLLDAIYECGADCPPIHLIGNHGESFKRQVCARYPHVHIVGPVEDPVRVLSRYRWGVLYEPLGGGFQMRVMDYIRAATPIFTVRGAFRGLECSEFTLVAEGLADLPQVIARFRNDEQQWSRSVNDRLRTLTSADAIVRSNAEVQQAILRCIDGTIA